tara:strand:+ start:226 stop:615 length:390 start_codon:yes stop_codon:yes gene_type:complete
MDVKSNRLLRITWLVFGLILSFIGIIGIIIPGLPTTIVMILAAACFFRSSERLYNWVIENKYYGHHVKNYREGLGMPKKAKVTAILGMWFFVSLSVLFGIPDSMVLAKILTIVGALTGTGYIINQPTIY